MVHVTPMNEHIYNILGWKHIKCQWAFALIEHSIVRHVLIVGQCLAIWSSTFMWTNQTFTHGGVFGGKHSQHMWSNTYKNTPSIKNPLWFNCGWTTMIYQGFTSITYHVNSPIFTTNYLGY